MIDPVIKEAWWVSKNQIPSMTHDGAFAVYLHEYITVAINAYLDAEAGRRMAKFELHYPDCTEEDHQIRHTWDLARWREELRKELECI